MQKKFPDNNDWEEELITLISLLEY